MYPKGKDGLRSRILLCRVYEAIRQTPLAEEVIILVETEAPIILPFRNAGETIRECMNSILAQSYPDWELIAIDDHSTDTSAEMIRGYSMKIQDSA